MFANITFPKRVPHVIKHQSSHEQNVAGPKRGEHRCNRVKVKGGQLFPAFTKVLDQMSVIFNYSSQLSSTWSDISIYRYIRKNWPKNVSV